jgi:hypothetical protein
MGGFSEHFLDKYFAYRQRYVGYIEREAPQRVPLAVLSEVVRLIFVTLGSAFCALLFWLLTLSSIGRGFSSVVWTIVFACCALGISWLGARAFRGLLAAFAVRRSLQERAAAAANDPP